MSEDFAGTFGEMPDQPATPTSTGPKHTLADFRAYAPGRMCIYMPCKEPWPNASVDARLPPQPMLDETGTPVRNGKGKVIMITASRWLEQNQSVEQMTWAPGLPELIEGRLVVDGGWIARPGATCLNLYRPPPMQLGDARKAQRWVDHFRKVYPDDADHAIAWLAQRVQHPEIKINHALVLGGAPGIGKDTLLEAVKQTVGPWNFHEVTPTQLISRNNSFLRSVIVRLNEARDMGESGRVDRFGLYDHCKILLAAPPDVLRINEKYLREYYIFNCLGMVITTNHRDALYLPSEDRRHYVSWSNIQPEQFSARYWNEFWYWYQAGGFGHVAVYLHEYDLSGFDPKAPPAKTDAFGAMVDVNRGSEEAELADAIDDLSNPDALTILQLVAVAPGLDWLTDHKARAAMSHRLARCGYVRHRNPDAEDGLWKINKRRQTIYVKAALQGAAQAAAAANLLANASAAAK
jgi:hypothetical protein